ncbi:MAG: hypothetical protein AUK03_17520 [Anaerolineae bacterium CG2_30_64_16]|nr:MAG: hypothetical protein AUK03_17520 [Anaerolineae bacterium CG2_30_64_16]
MTLQTITLKLSEPLYRTARQMAQIARQPIETVLQDSLAAVLPPLDDVGPDEAAELTRLALLNDAALWREARALMPPAEQVEMHNLLDRQNSGALRPEEQPRLQELMQLYGRLMVRKAHAYLLLARRGYRVPMSAERE